MGKVTRVSPEGIEQIRALRAQGHSYPSIASTLGVSKSSVYRFARDVTVNGKVDDRAGDEEGEDSDEQQRLLDWYEQREKELLEHVATLSVKLCKALDTIEQLVAEKEPS
jgi:transposase